MLSPVRLSVTRVDPTKTVEDKIMEFSPYGSLIPLVFVGEKFHPEILRGSPQVDASNKRGVGEICWFLSLSVTISKMVADSARYG